MSEPRKHHYLSQFYLQGFSVNGRSICQIEKRGGRAYVSLIRDTAAIRDYHELDYPDAGDPNVVEKRLALVETMLGEGLRRAIESGIATPETHTKIIELVTLLRVRVPAFKAGIEAFLQNVGSCGIQCKYVCGQRDAIRNGVSDCAARDEEGDRLH